MTRYVIIYIHDFLSYYSGNDVGGTLEPSDKSTKIVVPISDIYQVESSSDHWETKVLVKGYSREDKIG